MSTPPVVESLRDSTRLVRDAVARVQFAPPGSVRPRVRSRSDRTTRAFTLIELLIVTLIIMLLAALSLSALAGALEEARVQRTQGQITKIHQTVMLKYESFRTRRVRIPYAGNTYTTAQNRLDALRALIRAELPDRISDIDDNPTTAGPPSWYIAGNPSRAYSVPLARRAQAVEVANGPKTWTAQYEGAECLYLILSQPQEDGTFPLEFFKQHEIGDIDDDGFKEILDGWGRPIEFIRWAPGFQSPLQPPGYTAVDPFDPYYTRRPAPANPALSYPLVPLIYSPGPDGGYDIQAGFGGGGPVYATLSPVPNDPFVTSGGQLGTQMDSNSNGQAEWSDNIHNHILEGSR